MERDPRESTTQLPRPKKKYQNHIGAIYRNVINGLVGPMEEEFRIANCSAQTVRLICDTWFDKVKSTQAVDKFLSTNLRRRGSLSAAERAEAVAKRDMAVAQERMACTKFLLVGDGPKTKPAITSEGTIVQVPCNEEENESDKNSSVLTDTAEWSYPPDSGNLDPNHLVLVSLKIPLRTRARCEERSRVFKLRVPAFYIQQKKLESSLNKQMVKQLSEMPVSAANACIQHHLQSIIISEKYPARPMNLSKQLDGDPHDNLDEDMEFGQTSSILNHLYGKGNDCDSASSSSLGDDDQEDYDADDDADNDDSYQNNQRKNEKLSRKSKEYLKKLFYLCSDFDSQSSTDESSVCSDQSEDTDKENDHDDDDDDESDKDDKNEDVDENDKAKKHKFLSKSKGKKKSKGHNESDSIKSNDEDDEKFIDPPQKKLKIHTSTCKASKSYLKNPKNREDDTRKFNEDDINDYEEEDYLDYEPLNSDDDLESSESTDETDNVCICLFNSVKRTKKNWRIELSGGIMNVSGEDYAFNTANVVSKW